MILIKLKVNSTFKKIISRFLSWNIKGIMTNKLIGSNVGEGTINKYFSKTRTL